MSKFKGWKSVSEKLKKWAADDDYLKKLDEPYLNEGQRAAIRAIAENFPDHGMILADEVGMGKTRIAVTLARAVKECGGRTSIIVPPGLANQWIGELSVGQCPPDASPLRSIWGFLDGWNNNEKKPWSGNKVQIISQYFSNWRNSQSQEDEIHPQNLFLAAIKSLYLYEKNGYHQYGWKKHYPNEKCKCNDCFACLAAQSVYESLPKKILKDLIEGDRSEWRKQSSFAKGEPARKSLCKAIGYGLGQFDLVIIDEAHKNRGTKGNLSTLLEDIIWQKKGSRRLGMTATPVELDSGQWRQTFERIKLHKSLIDNSLMPAITNYQKAVENLQDQWRTNPTAREEYTINSEGFQKALSPYLLRRDKREDDQVKSFRDNKDDNLSNYRAINPLRIEFKELDTKWKQVVTAAEALSCMKLDDQRSKRLRLTIGNGHGIAGMINAIDPHENDKAQLEEETHRYKKTHNKNTSPTENEVELTPAEEKKLERADFWISKIKQGVGTDKHADINHPAIITVADEIIKIMDNEKVLVFGRFTAPMHALAMRLNGIALIDCVNKKHYWPRATLSDDEEKILKLLGQSFEDIQNIKNTIEEGMFEFQRQRDKIRRRLTNDKFCAALQNKSPDAVRIIKQDEPDNNLLSLITTAVTQSFPRANDKLNDNDIADALCSIIASLAGSDDSSDNDEKHIENAVKNITEELSEEYAPAGNSIPRSAYARVMQGSTSMQTRKLLQGAFNNPRRYPKVLIAQSMVGREGLNLQEACRTVIMLHLEWNPGVVEQQIGRVDRLNSLWGKMLNEAIFTKKPKDSLPQINIRPVIFTCTYDEHQWNILEKRWMDLRAQLHGEAVPPSRRNCNNEEQRGFLEKIDASAPSFSPTKQLLQ